MPCTKDSVLSNWLRCRVALRPLLDSQISSTVGVSCWKLKRSSWRLIAESGSIEARPILVSLFFCTSVTILVTGLEKTEAPLLGWCTRFNRSVGALGVAGAANGEAAAAADDSPLLARGSSSAGGRRCFASPFVTAASTSRARPPEVDRTSLPVRLASPR